VAKGAAIVLIAAVAAFLLLGRENGKGTAVVSCLEKTGATVEKRPHAKQLFPYMIALGSGTNVQPVPELHDASVYGVRYGRGEALLFFTHDSDDAASLEQVLVGLGARGGIPPHEARRQGPAGLDRAGAIL
jgi:hypothetical protein